MIVRTEIAPSIMADVPVIGALAWRGREYLIICTREEPGPPILAIREREQCRIVFDNLSKTSTMSTDAETQTDSES